MGTGKRDGPRLGFVTVNKFLPRREFCQVKMKQPKRKDKILNKQFVDTSEAEHRTSLCALVKRIGV